jgi:Zn-dependent peptidase ImmA (M78 family)
MATWERFAGDESQFAVRLVLRPDPDPTGVDADTSATWGSFQLWVDGKNLCAHVDQGETLESVHWYLRPLLEWFTVNWDPLLHEERLPIRVSGATAISSLEETIVPSLATQPSEAAAWEADWFEWWGRHALRAARDGGPFPDAVFRRWRDQIEVSWGDSSVAGGYGLAFSSTNGSARLDPLAVANPLIEVLTDAYRELSRRHNSEHWVALAKQVADLPLPEKASGRVAWMAGLRSNEEGMRKRWQGIEDFFAKTSEEVRDAALGVRQEAGVVVGSCQAALLFGAVSPVVTEADVETLARLLIDQYDPDRADDDLSEAAHGVPLAPSGVPWQAGYELAEEAREAFELSCTEPVDLEALYRRLNIETRVVQLDDPLVRGVALVSSEHRPTVAINGSSRYGKTAEARTFTMAHELCHLLYDRGRGRRLAVASGPWAPMEIEQRANAFAAHFLMPPEAIRSFLDGMSVEQIDGEMIDLLAAHFRVGRTAMIEHLHNLDLLDSDLRAELRGWL